MKNRLAHDLDRAEYPVEPPEVFDRRPEPDEPDDTPVDPDPPEGWEP